nr:hypothetical protein [Ferrimicrobium acidiphilum]
MDLEPEEEPVAVVMFGKSHEGGRLLGLPAYGVELAGQIYDSPAFLRKYVRSDERAFELMMEKGEPSLSC